MQAAYTLVDDETLDRLVELSSEELVAELETLERAPSSTVYLDQAWEPLHLMLTGSSASDPIEGDPLSEAVVGVHVFDGEDFIACTEHDEIAPILAALDSVDLAGRLTDADSVHRRELTDAFATLRGIHRRAAAEGRHLIVSIL